MIITEAHRGEAEAMARGEPFFGEFIEGFLRIAVAMWFHTRKSIGYEECRVVDQVLGPYREGVITPEFEAIANVPREL